MDNNFKEKFISARRSYIENRFSNLNPKQREAVLTTESPLLIVAGAGSGKTTVLVNRIMNILEFGCGSDSDFVPLFAGEKELESLRSFSEEAHYLAELDKTEPWKVLAITFTNKAAEELKNRLSDKLGEEARDIWAFTFHSCCVRILRRDADKLGYSPNFTIYDTNDSLSIIKQIIKELNLDEKTYIAKNILNAISRMKNAKISAEECTKSAQMSGDIRSVRQAEIYSKYQARLFNSNALDFDDLIFCTVSLFESRPDVKEYWQNRFRYILVDEYQDTNRLQFEFVRLLTGSRNNICVVGDEDQSIYKFRGATIENILSFESQFSPCRTIKLEQNYRSTTNILEAANAVIRNNTQRKEKTLWSDRGAGEKLKLYCADNQEDEADHVSALIMQLYGRNGHWSDNAILYRMNAQSSSIEHSLKRNGIPYRLIGGTRFYDRAEVKDVLAYMNVVDMPSDTCRLLRIINTPARGIGDKSLEKAQLIAEEKSISLFEVVSNADKYPELKRASEKMKAFSGLIMSLREFSANNPPDLLYDEILEKTGYLQMLSSSDDEKDKTRLENVLELKTGILTYMKETQNPTLTGYLADVALYSDMDNYDRDADAVVLMTIHSAKGLEFKNVYMVGMEETVFPGMRSIGNEAEMEEERRLCYVGLTRAKDRLYLNCARQRMLFGRTTANRVSRFVEEIPDDLIEKNVPKGYSYSDKSYESYRSERPRENKYSLYNSAKENSAKQSASSYSVGTKVTHKAFGDGVITKMTPMGGDYLIEIKFSDRSRKLMLRAAAVYMTVKQ